MAIDDPTGKLDSTFSNNVSRRRFIEVSVGAVACVSLSSLDVYKRQRPANAVRGDENKRSGGFWHYCVISKTTPHP